AEILADDVAGRELRRTWREKKERRADTEYVGGGFVQGAGLAQLEAVQPGRRGGHRMSELVREDVEGGRERLDLDPRADEIERRALTEQHRAAAIGAAGRAEERVEIEQADDAGG